MQPPCKQRTGACGGGGGSSSSSTVSCCRGVLAYCDIIRCGSAEAQWEDDAELEEEHEPGASSCSSRALPPPHASASRRRADGAALRHQRRAKRRREAAARSGGDGSASEPPPVFLQASSGGVPGSASLPTSAAAQSMRHPPAQHCRVTTCPRGTHTRERAAELAPAAVRHAPPRSHSAVASDATDAGTAASSGTQLRSYDAGGNTGGNNTGNSTGGRAAGGEYYPSTSMPVGGWLQPCRGCRQWTSKTVAGAVPGSEVALCVRCQSKVVPSVCDGAASQSVADSHAAPTPAPCPVPSGCYGFTSFGEEATAFSGGPDSSWLPPQAGTAGAVAAEAAEAWCMQQEQLLWQRQWEQQPWRQRQLETEQRQQQQQQQHAALMQH